MWPTASGRVRDKRRYGGRIPYKERSFIIRSPKTYRQLPHGKAVWVRGAPCGMVVRCEDAEQDDKDASTTCRAKIYAYEGADGEIPLRPFSMLNQMFRNYGSKI